MKTLRRLYKGQNKDKLNMSTKLVDEAENQVWDHVINVINNLDLLESQRKDLNNYYLKLKGHSPHTVRTYFYHLKALALKNRKSFKEMTKQDVHDFLEWKTSHVNSNRTVNDYIRTFKAFFRWLYDLPKHQFPDCVKDLELRKEEKVIKSRQELPTKEDFNKMFKIANIQQKCYLLMSLEGAYRRNELRKLTLNRVVVKDKYVLVLKKITKGTKHKESMIPHVIARHSIVEWLNSHPFKDDLNSPLFVPMNPPVKKFLSLDAMNRWVERLSLRAKISKKITPHRFRHLRVTLMKLSGKSNEQIRLLTGHTTNQMIDQTYSHIDNEDKVNQYLADYGIIQEKTKDLQTNKCMFCGSIFSEFDEYCPVCKSPPSKRALEKEEVKINKNFEEKKKAEELGNRILVQLMKDVKDLTKKVKTLELQDGKENK